MEFCSKYSNMSNANSARDAIREAILTGRLKPGTRLTERALAEEFGFGRTPLREALRMLSGDGLVETFPQLGAFVRELSIDEAIEILEVRRGLESTAAAMASGKATPEQAEELYRLGVEIAEAIRAEDFGKGKRLELDFHRRVVELSDNRELVATIANRGMIYSSLWQDVFDGKVTVDSTGPTCPSHGQIAEIIAAKDTWGAFKMMWKHFDGIHGKLCAARARDNRRG